MATHMKKLDIIHRRLEAMRMRWPRMAWAYLNQEALIIGREIIRKNRHG